MARRLTIRDLAHLTESSLHCVLKERVLRQLLSERRVENELNKRRKSLHGVSESSVQTLFILTSVIGETGDIFFKIELWRK